MKRLFSIITICLLMSSIAMAETDANRVRQQKARVFGLTIGYMQTTMFNSAPLLSSETAGRTKSDRFHGLQGGIVLNPEFGAGIGILTGVQYAYTPTYTRSGKPKDYVLINVSQHDLAIPLRIQYRYAFTPGFSVFAYTGPLFSVGLLWNIKESYVVDGKTELVAKLDFYDSSDTYTYSRLHCLWGIGAGVIFNQHIRLEVSGDWGMNNITPYKEVFTHLNRPINFAISYMF